MAAAKGNSYWQRRKVHGRGRQFQTIENLENACIEYFEWVENNPLTHDQLVRSGGEVAIIKVPRPRAMTIAGLCLFVGISHETWCQYRKPEHDFSEVIAWADAVIRTQKFEGAAANLFNANIISRDLGLADKQQTETEINSDGLSELMKTIGNQKLDLRSDGHH